MKKTAFISVFNKPGIDKFAKDLTDLGWEIMSSSGTAKFLKENGVACKDLADLVGEPILGHRVVSLSREFYAMLLSRPDNAEDMAELAKLKLPLISLVCCDMYPLAEEIEKHTHLDIGCPLGHPMSKCIESVIEKTDIGGPTMLRAAAKGGRIVVCDTDDREKVINWLKDGEPNGEAFKKELAAKAEYTVAKYCMASAEYLSQGKLSGFLGEEALVCKYGENAWQTPAFLFKTETTDLLALAHGNFNRLSGETLSYNNLVDLDRLLQTMTHIAAGFDFNNKKIPNIAIGVKHGNPCGVAIGNNSIEVLENMLIGDLRAIFGGLVVVNFPIGEKEANTLLTFKMPEGRRRLLDGIFAPEFTGTAVEKLKRKGDKCRFLANPALAALKYTSLDFTPRFRNVRGGFLKQPNYTFVPNMKEAIVEGDKNIMKKERTMADLILAWAIGSTSNSNTITIVRDGKLLGDGVGQQDRVGAAKLAIQRADDAANALDLVVGLPLGSPTTKLADLSGAVAYSDSFFPFPDGPRVLIDRGIKIIFATSGSVNDKEVIESCKQQGATLVMFPDKVARGFAWH